jgi:hypothetical protein
MSSKTVIEISLQYIFNGQYWILVQMCFTVSSKMRTQATCECSSLVRHLGSVVVFSTSCLVHWNAEVPPNSGSCRSCFTDRSRFWFCSGPILVWDASPRVLVVSTRTDEELSSSECKRRKFAGALASVFFYHEKHRHVEMSYSLTTSQICRYDFRFFFNWWHSPLAWWHSQELKFRKIMSK